MTERQPSGELVHSSGPLARLPCWLLNTIVIAAPFLVTASVMIPGIRLMVAVQYAERVAGRHIVADQLQSGQTLIWF